MSQQSTQEAIERHADKHSGAHARLAAILRRHRRLDHLVDAEQNRPSPDLEKLQTLKKQRLAEKDLAHLVNAGLRSQAVP